MGEAARVVEEAAEVVEVAALRAEVTALRAELGELRPLIDSMSTDRDMLSVAMKQIAALEADVQHATALVQGFRHDLSDFRSFLNRYLATFVWCGDAVGRLAAGDPDVQAIAAFMKIAAEQTLGLIADMAAAEAADEAAA